MLRRGGTEVVRADLASLLRTHCWGRRLIADCDGELRRPHDTGPPDWPLHHRIDVYARQRGPCDGHPASRLQKEAARVALWSSATTVHGATLADCLAHAQVMAVNHDSSLGTTTRTTGCLDEPNALRR